MREAQTRNLEIPGSLVSLAPRNDIKQWAGATFREIVMTRHPSTIPNEPPMQTLRVNGYDMAYLEVGQQANQGPPLVCVHGSLCDFRIWSAVLGPLTRRHRVIAVSLRHFFRRTGTASARPSRSRSMSTM
jgi:hypothetical protein